MTEADEQNPDGLSVVIPALNEASAIAETVRVVQQCLTEAGITFELIIVDDGSTDGTGDIAAAAGARVIRHLYNLGYGRSLKDGILAAKYPSIAISDADGTYPFQDMPKLFAEFQRGFDMVVGARRGKAYEESFIKKPLRRVLKFLVEVTAARKIPDINSGMRIFDREKAITYFERLCDTFSFTTSLTLAFIMKGHYVTYVPIDYHERIGRTKVRLLRDAVKTFQYIAEAAIYYNPLRIFLGLTAALIASGLALAIINVFMRREGIMLGIIGIFIASVVTFALGLHAVLLKQMLDRLPKSGGPSGS